MKLTIVALLAFALGLTLKDIITTFRGIQDPGPPNSTAYASAPPRSSPNVPLDLPPRAPPVFLHVDTGSSTQFMDSSLLTLLLHNDNTRDEFTRPTAKVGNMSVCYFGNRMVLITTGETALACVDDDFVWHQQLAGTEVTASVLSTLPSPMRTNPDPVVPASEFADNEHAAIFGYGIRKESQSSVKLFAQGFPRLIADPSKIAEFFAKSAPNSAITKRLTETAPGVPIIEMEVSEQDFNDLETLAGALMYQKGKPTGLYVARRKVVTAEKVVYLAVIEPLIQALEKLPQ